MKRTAEASTKHRKSTKAQGQIVPWKDDRVVRYIYFVRDGFTEDVIYVGQTVCTKGRWQAHERKDNKCKRLREYLSVTLHRPRFEICSAFESGVEGQRHAWAVEAYYIALYDTVYNMHTNKTGCNLNAGMLASEPGLKEQVEAWLSGGYKRPSDEHSHEVSLCDAAAFQVSMFENAVEAVREETEGTRQNEHICTALVEAKSELSAISGNDLRAGVLALANSIRKEAFDKCVMYDDACQTYLTPIRDRCMHLIETSHADALPVGVAVLYSAIRRCSLLFKDSNISHHFLRDFLASLATLMPTATKGVSRSASIAGIRAHCRPGWPGRPTVEDAIEYTRLKRNSPPSNVGTYTAEEVKWFDDRIANMADVPHMHSNQER